MVEDYPRDNSGEFSPNAIGKVLNRSSGAVHNALEKLVESGYAVLPRASSYVVASCLQRLVVGGPIASVIHYAGI